MKGEKIRKQKPVEAWVEDSSILTLKGVDIPNGAEIEGKFAFIHCNLSSVHSNVGYLFDYISKII